MEAPRPAGAPDLRRLGELARALLTLAMLPLVAVLGLALTRISAGPTRAQLIGFYVLPALALVGLALSLTRTPKFRVSLVLLLAALGIGTVTAEALLIVVAHAAEGSEGFAMQDAWDQKLLELRREGRNAYSTVSGNSLINMNVEFRSGSLALHPLSPSPAHVTAVMCDEGNGFVVYQSDRMGFNNPDRVWDDPDVELVIVGDSYMHGLCVESDQQVATRLRSRWRTINLGVRGAGPLHELGLIREYAASRRPPIVVWSYYEGNDLHDLSKEVGRPWLLDYLNPEHRQGLVDHHEALDGMYRHWLDSVSVAGHSTDELVGQPSLASGILRLPHLERLRTLTGMTLQLPTFVSPLGILPEVLERAKEDVAEWGGSLYLLYVPAYNRYTNVFGDGPPGRRDLLEAAASMDIPVIDLDRAFRDTGAPRSLWASPRGHLNGEGYRVTADAIAGALSALDTVR